MPPEPTDRQLQVLVVGVGMMGAQIGLEYALGGHLVSFVARDAAKVRERVEWAQGVAEQLRLATPEAVAGARQRSEVVDSLGSAARESWDVIVESVIEDLDTKAGVLAPLAAAAPGAIVASNASSLSITALADAIDAPTRTLGVHYWNPPLLMPPVEVIRGASTGADVLTFMISTMRSLGKEPVVVEHEVPGFVWNRLQMAVLREALWLVETGVASPETIDRVVSSGYARRTRYTGPFETTVLGGVDSWIRSAVTIFPSLSNAEAPTDIRRWLKPRDAEEIDQAKERRDQGLAAELRSERGLD